MEVRLLSHLLWKHCNTATCCVRQTQCVHPAQELNFASYQLTYCKSWQPGEEEEMTQRRQLGPDAVSCHCSSSWGWIGKLIKSDNLQRRNQAGEELVQVCPFVFLEIVPNTTAWPYRVDIALMVKRFGIGLMIQEIVSNLLIKKRKGF